MPVLFALPGICAAVLSAAVSFSFAVFPASAAVSGALSLSTAAVSVSGSFAAVSGSVGFFAASNYAFGVKSTPFRNSPSASTLPVAASYSTPDPE